MFTLGSVEHARPPEWDAQVIACDVLQLRRFGSLVAAKVMPRIAAPAWLAASGRADVRSRAHREGWAFWEASGAFVGWGDRTWSDVVQLASGTLLASRYPRAIDRVAWPALTALETVELAIRQGGIEELVVSPSERYVIAYLNSGQGEAGYELVSIDPLRVIEGGPGFTLPCMPSPPQFSPDESRIVCVIGARTEGYNWRYNERWWQSDAARAADDETAGSPGGPMPYARILVHELATYTIVSHRVEVDLPAGWTPDDPDEIHVATLVAVGNDHVVITTPSGPTRIAITEQSGRDGQTFRVR